MDILLEDGMEINEGDWIYNAYNEQWEPCSSGINIIGSIYDSEVFSPIKRSTDNIIKELKENGH